MPPLACAAALAVLEVIEQDGLLQRVATYGAAWKSELEKLVTEFPRQVRTVTGRGFMLGVVLHSDPAPYIAALRDQGFLAPMAGGNTVRMLPPLIATPPDLARATAALRAVLAAKERA